MFSALGAIVIVTGASLSAAGPAAARTGLASARGYNYGGELVNGANTSTNLPVGVKGLAGVTAVSAGSHHCLALLSDGTGAGVMLAAPLAALDIPLKVLVWEDRNGAVSVSYNSPGFLAERHHLEGALRAPFDAVESIVEALPGA
jgi:Domain of unknown function DUF302